MADLEFFCSLRSNLVHQERSVREFLIAAADQGKATGDAMAEKQIAVEALAHLSFVKTLDLDRAGRLRLARQLVDFCRSAVDKRQVEAGETFYVRNLESGLGGLANLASGDPGKGLQLSGGLPRFCKRHSVWAHRLCSFEACRFGSAQTL